MPNANGTFSIITFGCTLNTTDSLKIKQAMSDNGWAELPFRGRRRPDVYIVNTCGVKHATEQKIIHLLRTLSPVIVTGCLAHDAKLIHSANPGAVVVGVRSILQIPSLAQGLKSGARQQDNFVNAPKTISLATFSLLHPIAVQEGCTNNCSYCFTKYARSQLVCYDVNDIVHEAERAVCAGAKEIQITGQDTGAYYFNENGRTLTIADVLERVCAIPGDFRVRLGMINPEHVMRLFPSLMTAYRDRKMYKFFHMPVQSGSEPVLVHMHRKYTISQYIDLVNNVRREFPGCTIATDIIVGYPTETEDDFNNTMLLMQKLQFEVINISRFCARPFTEAGKLTQIDNSVVKARTVAASRLADEIILNANKKQIGTVQNVLLTEKGRDTGQCKGRTDSYCQVIIPGSLKLGIFLTAKITACTGTSLIGEKLI